MPLRVSRRAGHDGWWISGTVTPAGAPSGVRLRRRAGSDDERLAREEAAAIEAQLLRAAWHGERRQPVGFSTAALSYLTHEPRSAGTRALVRRLIERWIDTPISQIDQAALDRSRASLLRPGASPGTVRRNLITPMRAILSHAARRGWCDAPRFDLPAEPAGRTVYLLPDEMERLLRCASPHLRVLIRFLACTGCRLSEALSLDWRSLDLLAGRAIIEAHRTKSGRRRVAQLPPAAVGALAALPHRDGAVFRTPAGTPTAPPAAATAAATSAPPGAAPAPAPDCQASPHTACATAGRAGTTRCTTTCCCSPAKAAGPPQPWWSATPTYCRAATSPALPACGA